MRDGLENCSYDETVNGDLEIVGYNQEGTITSEEIPTPDIVTVYVENGVIILATIIRTKRFLR